MKFEELIQFVEENKQEHFQDIISQNEAAIKKIDEEKQEVIKEKYINKKTYSIYRTRLLILVWLI